jgi:hypothetical protein
MKDIPIVLLLSVQKLHNEGFAIFSKVLEGYPYPPRVGEYWIEKVGDGKGELLLKAAVTDVHHSGSGYGGDFLSEYLKIYLLCPDYRIVDLLPSMGWKPKE